VAKDRARPFSRKHRKYWIPVTGGMILIGAINVGLGYCTYEPPASPPKPMHLDLGSAHAATSGSAASMAGSGSAATAPTVVSTPGK